MILAFLAATTALADIPGGDGARFDACVTLIRSDAARAVTEAEGWTAASATIPARQCLAMAYTAVGRFTPAAAGFEQAALAAEAESDGRAANLWAQAGNAALAADDPTRARTDLDRALALPTMKGTARGEVLIDRARAGVALQDAAGARVDLDRGKELAATDPEAWLLSAALARRQGQLDRAGTEIEEAMRLAPDDAEVALEAGNIAAAQGIADAARTAWQRAVALAPNEPAGKAAALALATNR